MKCQCGGRLTMVGRKYESYLDDVVLFRCTECNLVTRLKVPKLHVEVTAVREEVAQPVAVQLALFR